MDFSRCGLVHSKTPAGGRRLAPRRAAYVWDPEIDGPDDAVQIVPAAPGRAMPARGVRLALAVGTLCALIVYIAARIASLGSESGTAAGDVYLSILVGCVIGALFLKPKSGSQAIRS